MKFYDDSTWWKRLFTVLEIAVACIGVLLVAFVAHIDKTGVPFYGFLIGLIPAAIIRAIRIAVTYVVDGKIN